MNENEFVKKQKMEAIQTAEKILQEKIGILEGLEILVPLLTDLELGAESEFVALIGVCDEGDRFPVEKTRKYWNEEKLKELDLEKNKFENFYKNEVFDACRKLIERLKR